MSGVMVTQPGAGSGSSDECSESGEEWVIDQSDGTDTGNDVGTGGENKFMAIHEISNGWNSYDD